MLLLTLLVLAPWAAMAAVIWPLRQMGRPDLQWGGAGGGMARLALGLLAALGLTWLVLPTGWSGLLGALGWALAPVVIWPWILQARRQKRDRLETVSRERQHIIAQRGTVQQQIMRAREAEAMERRMRRCKSALLLSKGNAEDLDFLLARLEQRVADGDMEGPDPTELVGGMAAHLRHVFIERDQDDLPLTEVIRHVDRWAGWLRELGVTIHVGGHAALRELPPSSKVPSMLFLGAAERWGIDALREHRTAPMAWTWTVSEGMVHLESDANLSSTWPRHLLKDWDAAFMLRHGGIAHAGGRWDCQLPLLQRTAEVSP